jgi:hypothetical protein
VSKLTLQDWADIGTVISGLAVVVAVIQLWFINEQLKAADASQKVALKSEKERRTLDACRSFHTDPTLFILKQTISKARASADPAAALKTARRDVANYLNYLESICIGIEQGIYDEEIVFDNLSAHIVHVVTWFVDSHPKFNPDGDLVVADNFQPLRRTQKRFVERELGIRTPVIYRSDKPESGAQFPNAPPPKRTP